MKHKRINTNRYKKQLDCLYFILYKANNIESGQKYGRFLIKVSVFIARIIYIRMFIERYIYRITAVI